MGNVKGFLEARRRLPAKRSVITRLRDSKELYLPQSVEQTREQASRCMDCGVPFCQQGCPLGNMIPDWNDHVSRDHFKLAYERLSATNNFPEFTGRICPAPCEDACTLAINDGAVTIEQMELEIIERAFREDWVQPNPPARRTGKRVAVVGSGPAGLAAAQQLNSAGHSVVVFEASDRLGGMLRYGIPDFKLEKWSVDRRIALLRREGIAFRTGARIGEAPSWSALHGEFDALLIAIGARRQRDIDLPGRDLRGVHFAMDYLEQQNRRVAGDPMGAGELIHAEGKRVIVLGGGDTGSDCYGTALRQGAAEVTQLQLWPAPPKERGPDNPWPQWAEVLRTSSSHEEGGQRVFALATRELLGHGGDLRSLRVVDIDVAYDDSGRRRAIENPETARDLHCDLLIIAIGFEGPDTSALSGQLEVHCDQRGNVVTDDAYRTNVEGVFCAGDAMRGASLIVWAIADGREAACSIDAHLSDDGRSGLPSKGRDSAFGGR